MVSTFASAMDLRGSKLSSRLGFFSPGKLQDSILSYLKPLPVKRLTTSCTTSVIFDAIEHFLLRKDEVKRG